MEIASRVFAYEPIGSMRLAKSALRCAVLASLGCGALLAALGGCGGKGGPERVVVSGTVTYNGKPLPEGEIRFVPLSTCPVPTSGALIVDGQYRAEGHGGVPVGTHKIQIEAYRKGAAASPAGRRVPPMAAPGDGRMQYLPAKYNLNTQLEITVSPGSPPITKNFELTD